MRVVGPDCEGRPVVYACARNQTHALKSIRDQILVTFEAACKIAEDDGTMILVLDMHGLKASLNMDFSVLKDLGNALGSVYAERLSKIVIIDFSSAVKMLWWLSKPLVSVTSQEKISFWDVQRAKDMFRTDLHTSTYERICS